jgi:acyl-CoA thioesterase-2
MLLASLMEERPMDDLPAASVRLTPGFPSLAERLAVQSVAPDVFRGQAPQIYGKRIYGGHLLAQALLAAQSTLPDERHILSLQAYFVGPGNPDQPLHYSVARVRDGRSFTVRAVEVTQEGRLLMTWRALFGAGTDGAGVRQMAMPLVPDPDSLPPLHLLHHPVEGIFKFPPGKEWWKGPRPFDIRYVDGPDVEDARRCFWLRSEPLASGGQNAHRAVLAFASDRSLISAISHVRGDLTAGVAKTNTSLDHTMWFHADVTAGAWLLYAQTSPYSTEGLGIAQGHLYNRQGVLVASVVQQGTRSTVADLATEVAPGV